MSAFFFFFYALPDRPAETTSPEMEQTHNRFYCFKDTEALLCKSGNNWLLSEGFLQHPGEICYHMNVLCLTLMEMF